MGELTKDQRLRRMLFAGFFPENLPPPFFSEDLAKFRSHLLGKWSPLKPSGYVSSYEPISYPRYGRARRNHAILNPVNFVVLAKEISDNWVEIRKHLKKSKISTFKPIFDRSGTRSLFPIDFSQIEQSKLTLLSKFSSCLKTDVSRYYPAIYTHSIPWALYGKKYCKINHQTQAFKSKLGNKLDVLVRNGQDKQSIGIPIGPDTSRVIGEIIGAGFDAELQKNSAITDFSSFRYVDDLYIGFDQSDSIEALISEVASALATFELEMNFDKTQEITSESEQAIDWSSELNSIYLSRTSRKQRAQIEHYFKKAFHFADINGKDNVLSYAIRRARGFRVNEDVWPTFEAYVLRTSRRNHTTIPTTVQILLDANYRKFALDRRRIEKFLQDLLLQCCGMRAIWEIAWLLFLAKGLRLVVSRKIVSEVEQLESSVCALLLLDLGTMTLLERQPDMSAWYTILDADGLKGKMWLLHYEGALKGWIDAKYEPVVAADKFFGPMLDKKVSFYSTTRNVKKISVDLKFSLRNLMRARFVMEHADSYF